MTAEEIMRTALASWNSGGIDAFARHLTPDAVWHAPDYLEGSEWHGPEALVKDWHEQFDSVFERIDVELEQMEQGRDGWLARVRGRGHVRDGDMELDWHTYFVSTFEGDLISDIWIFNEREDARRAAGLE